MTHILTIVLLASILFEVVLIGLKVYIRLTKSIHEKSVELLRRRAEIIVRAMDQSGFENIAKKQMAVTKLGMIASEFKINLSSDQASEYIEDAVNRIRQIIDPDLVIEEDVNIEPK